MDENTKFEKSLLIVGVRATAIKLHTQNEQHWKCDSSLKSHTLISRLNDADCKQHRRASEEKICKFTKRAAESYIRALKHFVNRR